MIKINKPHGRDMVILNLTDTQLSFHDWDEDNQTGFFTRGTISRLIEEVRPDLITMTGDLSYSGSNVSYRNMRDFISSFGISWTTVWGNHDNQGGADPIKYVVDEYKKSPMFLYESGDEKMGNGNFVITISDGDRIPLALIMMDTHDKMEYTDEAGNTTMQWAHLLPCQMEWYRKTARELKALGANEQFIFIHTPIYAYREAYRAAAKDPARVYSIEEGDNPESWNDGYRDSRGVKWENISSYPADEGMLDAILESGAKTSVICGHDHKNDFIINYRGVRLMYALKTGNACYGDERLNGGTVITVDENGVKSIEQRLIRL